MLEIILEFDILLVGLICFDLNTILDISNGVQVELFSLGQTNLTKQVNIPLRTCLVHTWPEKNVMSFCTELTILHKSHLGLICILKVLLTSQDLIELPHSDAYNRNKSLLKTLDCRCLLCLAVPFHQ